MNSTKKQAESTQRKFYMTSFEDDQWLWQQTEAVRMLWSDCAKSDRFGDEGGVELQTNMKRATFFKAKKVIEEYGAFKFEQYPGKTDGRKTRWFVTNLHGANRREYWLNHEGDTKIQSTAVDSKSLPVDSKSLPVDSKSLPVDSISSETLSLIQPCSSPDLNRNKERITTDYSGIENLNHRSGHSGLEAPLRVASACAPDAKSIVKESGATLIPTNPRKEDSSSNLIELNQNQYGVNSFVEENLPEAKDSAAPRQSMSHSHENAPQATPTPVEGVSTNATTTQPKEPYNPESRRIISRFFEQLPRKHQDEVEVFLFQNQTIALIEKSLPCDLEESLKAALCYIRKNQVDNLPALLTKAIADKWKTKQTEPVVTAPLTIQTPPAEPEPEPKTEEERWLQWESRHRAVCPEHVLKALDAANFTRERYEKCLAYMYHQGDSFRLRLIENLTCEQEVENYRKSLTPKLN